MESRYRALQVILRILTLFGVLTIGFGLYLWFNSAQSLSIEGVFLVIVGSLLILLLFVLSPVIDPASVRGQKRETWLQENSIKKFSNNKGATLIAHVFQKYIRHYPEAMKKYPERIPSTVEFAKAEDNIYNIIYKGTEYIFRFQDLGPAIKPNEQPDLLTPPKRARLEVFKNGRKRLDMTLTETIDSHYLPHWHPETIKYLDYGNGTWVRDMRHLIKDAHKTARYYIWNS
ncbi:MAG: hypothetical protein COU10_01565 [Candidatus Harrisonbacteria bacterium CG10_big_fil_rev_8_21_14_0_10_45_28]|uniref:Uncharacterized protein n=1 Tax=Candidatus Harrisonbacteria bacterium CG10_big_fil_rev_8_21_14_0_10_45_28 TaxID=1974586 RepID=A0A2H0UNK1_9BACT|nr:MAG: hypothetical protein COU10_01565 [Candidatus Harrisonbacteria bacterium CG10_big_fil_rev_8_21_14_0_10_45_28]